MPEWLTVKEAAAYLRVSRATIFNYCSSGRLPFFNLDGGGRRFKREDLDALLRPGTSKPSGDSLLYKP